jgi:diguanylate cyclase (GGDEF)-like protein/PAS domain S-box-containing protein
VRGHLEVAVTGDGTDTLSPLRGGEPDPALLRAALDVGLNAVLATEAWPVTGDGPRIVWANRAFEQLTGWPLAEVVGRTPRILQGPATDRAVLDEVREHLLHRQPVDVELVNYTRDGTPFWVHLSIVPIADDDGRFTHWVAVQRDVTARREAELRQVQQEQLVTDILSSMASQTVVLDRHGIVVAGNPAWERFWQRNGGRGEIGPGTDYLAACEPATAGAGEGHLAAQGIRAVLEGRAPRFGLDYECSSPTREAWYHCEVVPLRGADGHVLPDGGCVISHEDITARVLTERRLAARADHDELTGLGTRELLTRTLLARRRDGLVTTLLFCDIDDLRVVNDGLGHEAGDEVLRAVARRLTRLVPPGDLVCRWGGDEFVVACTGDVTVGLVRAARVHESLREPVPVAGTEVVVTMSIGVSEVGDDVSMVLTEADAAMHGAKARGSRTEIFTDALQADSGRRLDIVSGLRRAMAGDPAGGRLVLHRQPIVDLRSGRGLSWEALVRWERDGRLLLPEEFLPVLRGTDHAVELDLWVLSAACRAIAPEDGVRVSVNAGARTLADPRYRMAVERELSERGLPGELLGVEVTEETAAADDVVGVLEALRGLGVSVSFDDFGTGWSSLTNLVRLPVDTLKVDRLFVDRLATSEGQAVISAVVSMARALGLGVVAEGVETAEQRDDVLALGGTQGQGYLFARPEPWV